MRRGRRPSTARSGDRTPPVSSTAAICVEHIDKRYGDSVVLDADNGDVVIGGRNMTGRPAHTRELGVVFQSLALFPHLSVGDNVAFPLRMRRVGRKETAT